jgi:hypothetical protein
LLPGALLQQLQHVLHCTLGYLSRAPTQAWADARSCARAQDSPAGIQCIKRDH